jgi:hypothetical protein
MNVKKLTMLALAGVIASFFAGCQEKAATSEETVKTMQQYREEAAREITSENAEEQLDQLEKQINAEL